MRFFLRRFSTLPIRADRSVDNPHLCIVGCGPAALSAAIRYKQLAPEDHRVLVLEKAPEVGAHTLSGACIEPRVFEELFGEKWKDEAGGTSTLHSLLQDHKDPNPSRMLIEDHPFHSPALKDHMKFLTEKMAIPLPHPPQMANKGNYLVSLSDVVKWMAQKAEDLGVEIFPGIAASEILYKEDGSVLGVATNDVGIAKDGTKKSTFEPGMEIHPRLTLFAEGCRGSLAKQLYKKYKLNENCQHQTYGIGLKELWEIKPEKHKQGTVVHTVGWPLKPDTYGGSWLYHMADNQISIGLVVGLDYKNTYLNPYKEFQRLKHHPSIAPLLEGGTCLAYGARALNEGGYQSIPQVAFPGGAIIGASGGFMNVPKIKGTHTAMKTGMLAAEAAHEAISKASEKETLTPSSYDKTLRDSWVYSELKAVRNIRPSFHTPLGLFGGLAYSGLDTLFLRGKVPWTFSHPTPDHLATLPKSQCEKIEYPKPDGKISFDLLTNLTRSGTNHEEDQPIHLTLRDSKVPKSINWPEFDGPEGRYCPAGVYEYVDDPADGGKKLQINAQNCIHCKTCDIKDPTQNINWVTPQGGGGPQYNGT